MSQPPVFPLSHSPPCGPDCQPLTAFPQSLPVCLLYSGLSAHRHQFRPHPTTQTPGQALPVAFPHGAARGASWSLLRRWLSSVLTRPIQTAVCHVPCHVCACTCTGAVRRCARHHMQPPPRRMSFTRGLAPFLRRAAIAWSPQPGNPVQLRSDTSV
jgi:hypothetical protein